MDQKWLADGAAVLVLDAGNGAPGEDDYAPALVARLATEYHEPEQVLDSDPLAAPLDGPTEAGLYPGEVRGPVGVPVTPAPAPKPVVGPSTPDTSTRSTAAEDPNVTAPGSPAAVGMVDASSIIATIRELERRSDAGDADAQAELAELEAAFGEDDTEAAPAAHDVADENRTAPVVTTPETAAGNDTAPPAAAVGSESGDRPATAPADTGV
jgi:hypothetical protein